MRNCSFEEHFNKYNRMLIMILKSDHFFQPSTSLDKFKTINSYEKADTLYTMEYPLEELGEEEGSKYEIYIDLMNDRTIMSLFASAEFTDEENDNFYIILEKFGKTVWEV